MTVTRLLLVRHGESTWNAVRRWQGRADPPLSERGEVQARRAVAIARSLGPFGGVVTSTLRRARATGDVIGNGLGIDVLAPLDGLGERDAGEWEGLTRVEIEERYPGYLAEERRPPGYEGDPSIVERSSAALTSLIGTELPLLVVSHGGIIHALERAHDGGDPWRRLDNLTGRWFEIDHDGIRPVGERVALVPDGGPAIPPPDRGYA